MPTKSSAGPEEPTAGERVETNGVRQSGRAPAPGRVAEIAEAIAALVDSEARAAPARVEKLGRCEQTAAKASGRPDARLRVVGSPRAFGGKAAPRKQGHAWFEARFDELRGAVERLASANSSAHAQEIAALNARLDDLMRGLDGALEDQSHEDAFKTLKCQLVGLAGYLESAREWVEAGHVRVEARFDGVEGRLDTMDQSLERSRQAIQSIPEQTSAQISEAIRRIPIPQGLGRIERDVRALGVAARENEERTAEAVSELHGALQMILDQLASMGEKLSSAGEAADGARERRGTASSGAGLAANKSNVEPFIIPQGAAPGGSAVSGKFGKRVAAAGGHRHQRGSRLALVSAITILALTGVAMFAHHFRDPKSNELAAGGPWQSGYVQPPPAAQTSAPALLGGADGKSPALPPGPVVAKAEPADPAAQAAGPAFRAASGARPASDLWVAHAERPPVAPVPNSPDGSPPQGGLEWRGVEVGSASVVARVGAGADRRHRRRAGRAISGGQLL